MEATISENAYISFWIIMPEKKPTCNLALTPADVL